MKNVAALLFCALASSICYPLFAQPLQGFGLKTGFTTASALDNLDHFERRLGLDVLAYAEWFDLGLVSFITEAGYAQRGFVEVSEERGDDNVHLGDVKANTRLDYLTTALLVKVRQEGDVASPYIFAGPRLDVLAGRRSGTFEFSTLSVDSSIADYYHSPAFGGTVGIGTVLHRLPVPVFMEARLNLDVTDSMAGVPRDLRNNAVDLLIGIRLR